jgi:hypothetical protein
MESEILNVVPLANDILCFIIAWHFLTCSLDHACVYSVPWALYELVIVIITAVQEEEVEKTA